MLCVVSGQCQYSRKIFNGKTFAVNKNPQKPQKFSPSNDLMYTVLCAKTYLVQGRLSRGQEGQITPLKFSMM